MEKNYECKYCHKRGTIKDLRHHQCVSDRTYDEGEDKDDSLLLDTLIAVTLLDMVVPSGEAVVGDTPGLEGGGGDFGGGGASGDFRDSQSDVGDSSFDSSSSDSSSSD